jgi:hypothetical protein
VTQEGPNDLLLFSSGSQPYYCVVADGSRVDYGDLEADMRLAAAAPELLAACEMIASYTGSDAAGQYAADIAGAAIAKVRGEEP